MPWSAIRKIKLFRRIMIQHKVPHKISSPKKTKRELTLFLFLLIIAIIFPTKLFSISKIDSLEVRLINSTSMEKVIILNELSRSYIKISTTKAIDYGEEALDLAREINDNDGMIASANLLCEINLLSGNYTDALKNSEFLIEITEKSNDIKTLCQNIDKKAKVYIQMNEYVEALNILNSSLKIRIKTEDISGIGDSYRFIAYLFELSGDLTTAMEYLRKALAQYRKTDNKKELASTLLQTGIIAGTTDKAVEYLNEALKLFQESGDRTNVAASYTSLGKRLLGISDYDKAQLYLDKALKEFEEVNDVSGIAEINNALGELCIKTKRYNQGISYCNLAIQLSEEQSDKVQLGVAEKNTGLLLMKKGQFVNARQYLLKSLETFSESNNYELIAKSSKELLNIYLREGNYSQASKYNSLLIAAMDSIMQNQINKMHKLQNLHKALNNINNDNLVESKNTEIQEIILRDKQNALIHYSSIILAIILIILIVILYVKYRKNVRLYNNLKERSLEFEQKLESSSREIQEKVNQKIMAEQSRHMLDSVLNHIEESVIVTDSERRIIYVNDHFEKITQFPRSEVLEKIPDFFGTGQLPEEIFQTVSSGQKWQGTLITKRKDGSMFHEASSIFPLMNSDNKIKYYAAIKRDISESLSTNEVLEKSEAILNSMLIHNQNSILLIDTQYNILIFNPNAEKVSTEIFGIKLVENDTILRFVPQDGLKSFKHNFMQALAGNTLGCKKVIKDQDEKDHTFRINFAPVETEDEKVIAVLLSIYI